jgi:hypothetical protein
MPNLRRLAPLGWALLVISCERASPPAAETVVLERVSTAVPWPRGLAFVEGRLIALARGIHRSAGGPNPEIEDLAGHLFEIDPNVAEPVVKGQEAGGAVRKNGRVFAEPAEPPFHLWNRRLPSTNDTRTDRPYCAIGFDPESRNMFICAFSGIDRGGKDYAGQSFRKNPTDGVFRYDLRTQKWHVVDAHRHDSVPEAELQPAIRNEFYPHHDPSKNPPPHGMANGPDDATVCGRFLYVAAKDNSALIQYDLDAIRSSPDAPPPPGRYIFRRANPQDDPCVQVEGHDSMYVEGTCALAAHGGYLYVAFRTTSQILRFPITGDGDLVRPLQGQYIAQFDRYDPEKKGGSADIYDIGFNSRGELFVAASNTGAFWRIRPDPSRVFDGRTGTSEVPYVNLRELTDHPDAKVGDFTFDAEDNLYLCSGNKDVNEGNLRGTIYRVRKKRR